MDEIEVLELYEIHYSDLLLLSSSSASHNRKNVSLSLPEEELERLKAIRKAIIENLGPKGPGLLSIIGVPRDASLLRRNLLPLARNLALLDHERRKRVLKEHTLGSDVPLKNPDRNVSSFAMQLKYVDAMESASGKPSHGSYAHFNSEPMHLHVDKVKEFEDDEFKNLADAFRKLGYFMMELGLLLAQICDELLGGQELEQSLLESGTAKGRLIHYHSILDNHFIRETGKRKVSTKKQANSRKDQGDFIKSEQKQLQGSNLLTDGNKVVPCGNHTDLWQQWHYDYGIFTVLTAPVFLLPPCSSENMVTDQYSISCDQECPYPDGHSYLQIFDPNKNNVLMVKTSPESFIIQVGESADILSKGKLQSTLHCVCRPVKLENVSRETFVVFLQPAWGKTFSTSDYPMEHSASVGNLSNEGNGNFKHGFDNFVQDIHKIVPPLSSRLKDGMTFAEFSRETTKQYYGGSGLQSNR
ncbi:hypothetical protein JCGZ_21883 [Jatropha curcas]|uniref:Isopenicillin N synthase-like Fe(2+) 2OG dioxygenase domain-containing protein n=1 Tax=Jatropha curcas TaxID=180498 RepID=A0A067JC74_JATCU|nr:hypothetical protein JCGZ_21883 [Jatropha curcas]